MFEVIDTVVRKSEVGYYTIHSIKGPSGVSILHNESDDINIVFSPTQDTDELDAWIDEMYDFFLKARKAMIERHQSNAKLKELGFITRLDYYSGQVLGSLFLRSDGSLWGNANDGNVPGLENTGLVECKLEDGAEVLEYDLLSD